MKRRRAARVWDLCAAGLSSACILHCLGMPLLTVVLPVVAQSVDSHLVHVVMVMLAVPVTLWVVRGEVATSRGRVFSAIAMTGLTLMLAAVLVPALEESEVLLTLTGGTLLGGAHLWRWSQHPSKPLVVGDDV